MIEVLNNPVWHAMQSGNQHLVKQGDHTKLFQERISPFVGMKDFTRAAFEELLTYTVPEVMVIVSKEYVNPTESFEVIGREPIIQMVFTRDTIDASKTDSTALTRAHVPAMLELTQLTKPGPFLENTIRLGNYFGIYQSGRLAAMAGRRFYASPFVEISAVCTHPDFAGRGYAASLINNEIGRIIRENCTPYLHVRPSNENAIRLYKKLGFEIHQEVNLVIMMRNDTGW